MGDFSRCVAVVCGRAIEGGYVDDPQDAGGPTNHGITLATLSTWRGRPCTADDVQALGLDEATAIYRAMYWTPVNGEQLAPGVDLITFDAAVNQGAGTAARMLQHAVGATPDGEIGRNTLRSLAAKGACPTIRAMRIERMLAYQAAPGWPRFGRGWTNRVNAIFAQAMSWANGGSAVTLPKGLTP